MPRFELEQQWQELASEVLSGFRVWRTQHPTATLSELEEALDARWAVARARVLEDAALTSAAADWPRRGGAAGLSGLWQADAVRRDGGAPADDGRRADADAASHARPLPGLWDRAFPPWMRNWAWCRAC